MRFRRLTLALIPLAFACGQDAEPTRAGQIEAERQAKAAVPIPPEKDNALVRKTEAIFGKLIGVWTGTQTGTHGFTLRLGGLAVGSGIAGGPEYIYKRGDQISPRLIVDGFAVGSAQGYYLLQGSVEFPKMLGDHAFFSALGQRYDYPRLAYYGPGDESRKTGGTNYRMEDNSFGFRLGWKPVRRLRIGVLGSFQNIQISPGTSPTLRDTDVVYTVAQAHGLDRQTNFWTGGVFAQFDSRDESGDPRAGSFFLAQFQNVNGSRQALGGFNQYDLEYQQYFHYWNKRRVIAFRAKASLTTPHANTFVPFYLEPRLGGSDDLRGFRPYRFYDQNSAVATVEYRWTVLEPLDMAVFADAGKVYHDADQFSLSRIQTDIGFGLRVRTGDTVPLRLDVGFSREGVQIWLNFYNVF